MPSPSVVFMGGRALVLADTSDTGRNIVQVVDTATGRWTVSTAPNPMPLYQAGKPAGVWTGSEVVFPGVTYTPSEDRWTIIDQDALSHQPADPYAAVVGTTIVFLPSGWTYDTVSHQHGHVDGLPELMVAQVRPPPVVVNSQLIAFADRRWVVLRDGHWSDLPGTWMGGSTEDVIAAFADGNDLLAVTYDAVSYRYSSPTQQWGGPAPVPVNSCEGLREVGVLDGAPTLQTYCNGGLWILRDSQWHKIDYPTEIRSDRQPGPFSSSGHTLYDPFTGLTYHVAN